MSPSYILIVVLLKQTADNSGGSKFRSIVSFALNTFFYYNFISQSNVLETISRISQGNLKQSFDHSCMSVLAPSMHVCLNFVDNNELS